MDPIWILVFLTGLYATFTFLSVLESRKHRKTIWELEGNRRRNEIVSEIRKKNEEISQLRNLLFTELASNSELLEHLLKEIKILKNIIGENREIIRIIELWPFYDVVYKTILPNLGILPYLETWAIVRIYTNFHIEYYSYSHFVAEIKSGGNVEYLTEYITKLENHILDNKKLIECWRDFYTNRDFPTFEKKFNEIIKRRIDNPHT